MRLVSKAAGGDLATGTWAGRGMKKPLPGTDGQALTQRWALYATVCPFRALVIENRPS